MATLEERGETGAENIALKFVKILLENGKKEKSDDPKPKTAAKPKLPQVPEWNEAHRKALAKSLSYVCDNTSNITRICVLLIEKGIISFDDRQEIESQTTNTKKMLELVRLFLQKGFKALEIFKDILIKTGNEHVEANIRVNEEYELLKAKDDEKNDENEQEDDKEKVEKPKKKKKSHKMKKEKKKGKLFSLYAASEDETSESSEEEEVKIDEDNPDIEGLLDFMESVEQKLKTMMYYPQQMFTLSRFVNQPTEQVHPLEEYQNTMLKFKTNRAIFLQKLGFYGPATIPLTSFDITVKISIFSPYTNPKDKDLGELSEVVECQIHKLMYVTFDKPVAIRPHIWHCITFTIKGQAKMFAQNQANKEKFLHVDYQLDSYDAVRLEFDIHGDSAIGQIPELIFFKAKDRIPAIHFKEVPAEYTNMAVITSDVVSSSFFNSYYPEMYAVSRFKHGPTEAVNPLQKYQNSLLKFRTNRAIFLKRIGFYGQASIPLTSYEMFVDAGLWKDDGSLYPLTERSAEVVESKLGEIIYITLRSAIAVKPHAWHFIMFTILGQEKMAAQNETIKDKFVFADYNSDDYDAVRFEFDLSEQYTLGQIPELCFHKAKERIHSSAFPEIPLDEYPVPVPQAIPEIENFGINYTEKKRRGFSCC